MYIKRTNRSNTQHFLSFTHLFSSFLNSNHQFGNNFLFFFGVVVMKKSTEKVQKIVEKTKIFVGNKINTGISLLNPSVLAKMHSFFFFLLIMQFPFWVLYQTHSRELVVLEWGVLDILVQEEFYWTLNGNY